MGNKNRSKSNGRTMGLILLIPFVIEVIGDAFLIRRGNKDIHWTVRVLLIVIVSLVYGDGDCMQVLRGFILACIPFPLFDPLLNVVRFGSFKKWNYIGRTKQWDKIFQHWKDEFGVKDWMFLSVRILFTALLITLYYVI